jgi:hypothetical protein
MAAQQWVDRDLEETATPGYGVLDFKAGLHTKPSAWQLAWPMLSIASITSIVPISAIVSAQACAFQNPKEIFL